MSEVTTGGPCVLLRLMAREGYVQTGLSVNPQTGESFEGYTLQAIKSGRQSPLVDKNKPLMVMNYCPGCGSKMAGSRPNCANPSTEEDLEKALREAEAHPTINV